ncbi:hypothetical protein V144x_17520 [Gimesia aquarii]|uniref:Uncharacterized protein n=1 Tax=Gimesia aquarii TaxID=2527964 RepID=A0A517VTG1_9PLAN|nr:hypothetical protein V144x_17520 [Gimesia aquarii]
MTENKESRILRFLGYSIPILLVSYVLSIGPVAAWVLDKNGNAVNTKYMKPIMIFYGPLEWCASNNKFVGDSIRAYIDVCNGTDR